MFKTVFSQEKAHEDGIWAVAWSQNAKSDFIVTGSVDDTVKTWLWDDSESTLTRQQTFEGHKLGVLSVDIDREGTKAISSSIDGQIKVWDVVRGKYVRNLDTSGINPWTAKLSPDTQFVACGTNKGQLEFLATETGERRANLPAGDQFISSVAYSADNHRLACASMQGTISIFDLSTAKLLHKISDAHSHPVRSLSFTPDSKQLLTASDDGYSKCLSVEDGKPIASYSGHASWVLSVCWSSDGQHFATSSSDHTVKVWDSKTRQCEHTFNEHQDQVWGIAYNGTGTRLASVSDDQSIRIFECP